jgi:hypothetical protein
MASLTVKPGAKEAESGDLRQFFAYFVVLRPLRVAQFGWASRYSIALIATSAHV